jgi:hypothetical protein
MIDTEKRMSLAELEMLPEYMKLTQKQKLFIATYCEFGLADGNYDAVEATRIAYKCKNPEVARIMSYSLMQNIRIIAVLNRHFNATPIEEFLVMLDRAINNKKLTVAQIQALRLKCEVMGFTNKLPAQAPMIAALREAQDSAKETRKSKRKKYERAPVEAPRSLSDEL